MRDILIEIGLHLLSTLLPALVIGVVGARAVALYEKITNSKLSLEQRARIDAAILKGIGLVEEQAHKFAKSLAGSAPATAGEKLRDAEKMARELEPELLKEISSTELRKLIESFLPSYRKGAESVALAPPV